MGKRKIGEIYNRPIIEGDINLKTPYEIHKSELAPQSGGGSAGGGEEKIRYCKVLSIFGVEILGYTAAIVKCNVDGTVKFYPTGAPALDNLDIDILAAGIIISDSYEGFNATGTKFEEMYAGLVNEGLLQTITEEEFYNLEA